MKTKSFRYTGIVLAVLLLFAVGPVQGQEPEPLPEGDPEGPEFILAQPPYTMNYQGYLTDSSGTPLDGVYNLAFELWNDVSVGSKVWGAEAHNGTQVTNGLFQVTLGSSAPLYPDYFYEALFLAVQVNGTPVDPRQPLHAVPYAFGLVPGAVVFGDSPDSQYALYVENTGSGSSERGLYARGSQYGIYATEFGSGNVAIYSNGFVHASGYKSNGYSYWWYDANGMQTEDTLTAGSGAFDIKNYWKGGVELDCSSTGEDYVLLPLDVPGVLLGQNVRVVGAEVYYHTTNSATYIERTWVYKSTGTSGIDYKVVAEDTTAHSSTSATSYSIAVVSGSHTLTWQSGNLLVLFDLECGSTAHDLFISGVRLRLSHTD